MDTIFDFIFDMHERSILVLIKEMMWSPTESIFFHVCILNPFLLLHLPNRCEVTIKIMN